ncbi:hypothetical protein HOLleu_38135 [Holothuria leucospilota]|uniref:Uncharacterized protein n=1 Tax=Holothuria leucospilota TaxID=206669 RepID=A0A9Q1BDW9_HOLLE|nr:hypothetical protein HOLleu_38135 [Holothuria leucospilota]
MLEVCQGEVNVRISATPQEPLGKESSWTLPFPQIPPQGMVTSPKDSPETANIAG